MDSSNWLNQEVHGRDKVLREIEIRANAYGMKVVQDVRDVMHDYEVDMYRLVLSIGKHYGMDRAYEIMSETVAQKRLKWVDQVAADFDSSGGELERGLNLYRMYFQLTDGSFQLIEQTDQKVAFRRKDYIDAIAYACEKLGLDNIEVNNKVYAKTMDLMFQKIGLNLHNEVIKYQDGWYDEEIRIITG